MLAHIYKIIFNQLKIDMFAKMNSELDRKFVIYINFFCKILSYQGLKDAVL